MPQKYFFLCLVLLVIISCKMFAQLDEEDGASMKDILTGIYLNEDPENNYTRNDLSLEKVEKEIADGNTSLLLELSIQLMMAGKEQDAVDTINKFIHVYNLLEDLRATSPEATAILEWIPLIYFRQGEVSNCINNHNINSCIMPLTKDAQHVDPLGSASALAAYADILQYQPQHPTARWMFNLSAMTLGLYPEKVPKEYFIDFEKFRDTAESFPIFKDVAQNVGISQPGHFGGAIMEDFNNDGLLDLFDTDNPLNSDVRLFIRQTDGSFKNMTDSAGLTGITGGANAMQTDFNNDGWVDIFITRGGWLVDGGRQPESLLRNNGNGTFTDVTKKAGLLQYSPSHSATWADFDNDGFLDLIVGYETGSLDQLSDSTWKGKVTKHKTKVYRNNQNEGFIDVTATCGLAVTSWVKGVTTLDYNKDGKQDVYLSIFNDDNRMYKNVSTTGTILFENASVQTQTQQPKFSFPTVSADFNNDGWPDLFVAGYHTIQQDVPNEYLSNIEPLYPCYTYINQGDGTFRVDSSFMLPQSIMAMSLNVADLDNDGFVDIYMGTGAGMFTSLFPNIMLKNVDGKRWADVTTASRLGHLQKCHGIAMGDVDRDGDIDMYVELGGLFLGDFFWNALYQNELVEKKKWVNIKLEGETSNKLAIGATIVINYTEKGIAKTIWRAVNNGGSYGASPIEQHIGLNSADAITNVTVMWPSGKVNETQSIALNEYYHWKETETLPTIRSTPAIPLNSESHNHMHHHHH